MQSSAKNRAKSVRDALESAGIAEDRIELRKPEMTTVAAIQPKLAGWRPALFKRLFLPHPAIRMRWGIALSVRLSA